MGLLDNLNDGVTSLKSIPFGDDQPGGGSSKQPYIRRPINLGIKNPAFYNEFIIRGGIEAPLSAAEDVVRLTKYFLDVQHPQGLLFIAKQNILSRVGVKTEAAKGLGYAGGAVNEGIYTPLSTIGQALVGFTGTHLNKQGLDPTGLIPGLGIKDYGTVVYNKNLDDFRTDRIDEKIAQNRKEDQNLQKKIEKSNQNLQGATRERQINRRKNNLNDLNLEQIGNNEAFIDLQVQNADLLSGTQKNFNNRLLDLWDTHIIDNNNSSVILKYGGGPDSFLGIGKTKIKFATDPDGVPIKTGKNRVKADLDLSFFRFQPKWDLTDHPWATSEYIRIISKDSTEQKKYTNQILGDKFIQLDGTNYNFLPNELYGVYQKDVVDGQLVNTFKPNPNLANDLPNNKYETWTQQDFIDQPLDLDTDIKNDFREKLDINAGNTFLSATTGYKDNNIEDKFGMGNPGIRNRNRSNPYSGSILQGRTTSEPLDKVTAYPIYKLNSNKPAKYGTDTDLNDLIEFSIAILNNDNQNDPRIATPTNYTYKKYMHFRAFIDNISDSYNAEWDSIEYMGRAEKFYKYGGFSRKMGLAFTVVAQSKDELNAMYDKLNFLASSLAPEYLDSSSSGYMAGNIAYITLGDYINDQPGVITGVDFDIPEDSPWEINRDTQFNSSGSVSGGSIRQLPYMIKVKVDFIPIQKFRPEKQSWRNHGLGNVESELLMDPGNQRFIDSNNPYNTRGTKYAPTQVFATDSLSTTQVPIQTQQAQNIITTTSVANSDPSLEPGGAIGLVM